MKTCSRIHGIGNAEFPLNECTLCRPCMTSDCRTRGILLFFPLTFFHFLAIFSSSFKEKRGCAGDFSIHRGFKSHPPHQNSSSVLYSDIYLMGAEPTYKPEKQGNKQDKKFEQAVRRLKSTPNISEQDKSIGNCLNKTTT
jgi:hypothetical protein